MPDSGPLSAWFGWAVHETEETEGIWWEPLAEMKMNPGSHDIGRDSGEGGSEGKARWKMRQAQRPRKAPHVADIERYMGSWNTEEYMLAAAGTDQRKAGWWYIAGRPAAAKLC